MDEIDKLFGYFHAHSLLHRNVGKARWSRTPFNPSITNLLTFWSALSEFSAFFRLLTHKNMGGKVRDIRCARL